MIPGKKRQPPAIGRQPWRRIEIMSRRKNSAAVRLTADVNPNNRVDRLPLAAVIFPNPDPPPPARIDKSIRVTPLAFRRKRQRLVAIPVHTIQPVVVEIGK